jgi:hypothetical protein
MCSPLDKLVGLSVYPVADLYATDKDGNKSENKLLSGEKSYKIIAVLEHPRPYCILVKNDFGIFDLVHISNFKVPDSLIEQ